MSSLRPISKFGNLNVSLDSVSLPPPGFGVSTIAGHQEWSDMKPWVAPEDFHKWSFPSMMQPRAHGESIVGRSGFGVKMNSLRPFNDISTGYLDHLTESLWNGAVNSALNVSTTSSSDGVSSGCESESRPPQSRPSTPLFGRPVSFFGDFDISKLQITPTKQGNNSIITFHPEKPKAASERKVARQEKKCAYCKGPHQVKDKHGVTTCPELRALKCPVCDNKNPDLAHTVRFCPQIRTKMYQVFDQLREIKHQNSYPVLPSKAA